MAKKTITSKTPKTPTHAITGAVSRNFVKAADVIATTTEETAQETPTVNNNIQVEKTRAELAIENIALGERSKLVWAKQRIQWEIQLMLDSTSIAAHDILKKELLDYVTELLKA